MDNKQLLQQIGTMMDSRFATFQERMAAVIVENCAELHEQIEDLDKRLVMRLDSIDRRLALQAGILSHVVEWADKFEDEMVRLSKELADVQTRLSKLEGAA